MAYCHIFEHTDIFSLSVCKTKTEGRKKQINFSSFLVLYWTSTCLRVGTSIALCSKTLRSSNTSKSNKMRFPGKSSLLGNLCGQQNYIGNLVSLIVLKLITTVSNTNCQPCFQNFFLNEFFSEPSYKKKTTPSPAHSSLNLFREHISPSLY